jgi:hypothetical protein
MTVMLFVGSAIAVLPFCPGGAVEDVSREVFGFGLVRSQSGVDGGVVAGGGPAVVARDERDRACDIAVGGQDAGVSAADNYNSGGHEISCA